LVELGEAGRGSRNDLFNHIRANNQAPVKLPLITPSLHKRAS